jgi:hypothetical protein
MEYNSYVFLTNEGNKEVAYSYEHHISHGGLMTLPFNERNGTSDPDNTSLPAMSCRRRGSSLTVRVLDWAGTGHYDQPPALSTLPIKAMFHRAMIIFNVYDIYLRFHGI